MTNITGTIPRRTWDEKASTQPENRCPLIGKETVWRILVDADRFPAWNSTVVKIEGMIEEGARLRIDVPGTTRTFIPKVSDMVEHKKNDLE